MMRKFYALIVTFISLVTLTPCICYAEIVSIDITVSCGESMGVAPLYQYPGNPSAQVSLETKGMLVDKILFTNLHGVVPSGTAEVLAACTPQPHHVYQTNMWPPDNKIVCAKGMGLAVRVISPNSDNPTKYRYLGTLTVKIDDKDVEAEDIPTVSLANILGTDIVVPNSLGGSSSSSSSQCFIQ